MEKAATDNDDMSRAAVELTAAAAADNENHRLLDVMEKGGENTTAADDTAVTNHRLLSVMFLPFVNPALLLAIFGIIYKFKEEIIIGISVPWQLATISRVCIGALLLPLWIWCAISFDNNMVEILKTPSCPEFINAYRFWGRCHTAIEGLSAVVFIVFVDNQTVIWWLLILWVINLVITSNFFFELESLKDVSLLMRLEEEETDICFEKTSEYLHG